jgi:hypothetical protein
MHKCATAKLESQRTAGTKTPEEGDARAALNYYYVTVGPKRHQGPGPGTPEDTRGDQEGHQGDWRAHGTRGRGVQEAKRHRQDGRAQQEDRERHQEDRREQRRDRSGPYCKARGIQQPTANPGHIYI